MVLIRSLDLSYYFNCESLKFIYFVTIMPANFIHIDIHYLFINI